MKKIIVSTGYMGSGSSAITDLVSEFKNCSRDNGNYEFVFLHCPNGLFDLEDKLLLGNNAIRSDEALRTFESQMKKLYDKKYWWVGNYKKIIGNNFIRLTRKYIENIAEFNYTGYWYTHEEVNFKMYIKLVIRKIIKILSFNKIKFRKVLKYKDGMRISFISKKRFYDISREYIYSLIEKIAKGTDNVVLDQLLLPFNLYRIDNYFDDKLKVIVVERDPRDVFIINKYIWNEKKIGVPIPTDVKEFCKYYKKMRESEIKTNSNKILRIKFEDLIYNYDLTMEKIYKFLDFSKNDHINKRKKFNPQISINNTQLFNNTKYLDETKIIEKELSKFLYKFPYKLNNEVKNTIEFDE